MIRTAKEVIAVAKARGLTIRVDPGPPPMPVLQCPDGTRPMATDTLLNALRAWRIEIIEEVGRNG